MSREIIDFIEDILEAIEDIETFTRGLTFDHFSQEKNRFMPSPER